MSRDCCVALPRGTMGLSAVCDCGIFSSYSLTIFGAQKNCLNDLFLSDYIYIYCWFPDVSNGKKLI